MRLIGSVIGAQQGETFSRFLNKAGINHQLELITDRDWGSSNYGTTKCNIWIQDEERVNEAQASLERFNENPQDPEFTTGKAPLPITVSDAPQKNETTSTKWEKQSMGPITRFFLIICAGLLFLEQIIPSSHTQSDTEVVTFFSSPIEKALLFDFPRFYELLNKFIHLYGMEGLQKPETLSKDGYNLLAILNKTPYWQGFYSFVIEKGFSHLTDWKEYPPMFEKIREGEIWRLFTPALLHANIFHLFFNMIWLIVLGKQLEQRMKPGSYILFILILGIFSNTCQYLMGGPNFVGFSGILVGMLTFIWMRQRNTPWEGYQLDRATFIFMMVFIFGVAGLQLISFITEKSMQMAITPNIANTAHLSGALAGLILGKFNFFGWRKS